MIRFNMLSHHFSHDVSSTVNQKPKNFVWDFFTKNNEISFYIDMDVIKGINDKSDGRKKYLWLLESEFFNNGCFEFIKNNLNLVLGTFECIFTYNEELLLLDNKFKWTPAMGTWIREPKIYEKTKLISMVTSNKTFTPQQRYRVNYANLNINEIDVYGRGYNEIINKEDGLIDYMFSVCIENSTMDTYFTEKILDCFATGTIPIYKGTKNIVNHFDHNGILFLDEININDLNSDLYYSKIESIQSNLEKVKDYLLPEEYIFNKYIKNI